MIRARNFWFFFPLAFFFSLSNNHFKKSTEKKTKWSNLFSRPKEKWNLVIGRWNPPALVLLSCSATKVSFWPHLRENHYTDDGGSSGDHHHIFWAHMENIRPLSAWILSHHVGYTARLSEQGGRGAPRFQNLSLPSLNQGDRLCLPLPLGFSNLPTALLYVCTM